ncbi:TPA: Hok/Gef family protein [Vibrio parahaemolyticus]
MDSSLFTNEGQVMPDRKYALLSLIIVCITTLCALWIVRDSLCEFEYHSGGINVLAKLTYEVK